jgi:hypothetical protein
LAGHRDGDFVRVCSQRSSGARGNLAFAHDAGGVTELRTFALTLTDSFGLTPTDSIGPSCAKPGSDVGLVLRHAERGP